MGLDHADWVVRHSAEGKRQDGVWVIEQAEIIRLGRTEWQANETKPSGT